MYQAMQELQVRQRIIDMQDNAAAEAAIGLAILVVLFRNLRTINVDDLDKLKG